MLAWPRVLLPLVLVVGLVSACVSTPGTPAPATRSSAARATASSPAALPPATVRPDPGHVATLTTVLQRMRQQFASLGQIPGPADVLDYDLGALWTKGIDGTGTTIALIEGWNDPYIGTVIGKFDHLFGLPDPDIRTIYPSGNGHLPPQCPPGMAALGTYGSCDAWAVELTLDVEAVHLVAPYAKIVLAITPADSEITDDAASQVAPPEMMQAVETISAHHLADVVSISDGTGESTYSDGTAEIHAQDPGELAAAAAGIPVVVGTGDCGAVQNLPVASSQCGDVSAKPDTAAWDDSPWVTAVGGTVPNLSPSNGARLGPDPVWQEDHLAEGAGFSSVYPRPDYQNGVASITGSAMRSVPDITMDAQLGTSEAAPLFAGVLALATQLNHGVVGPINDALYRVLGPRGAADGITDVVTGGNGVPGVPGFTAGPGFDVASGWGTVDAGAFVPALVGAVRSERGGVRARAAAELATLRAGAHLAGDVTGPATLSGGGFLPRHPVRLAVDGHPVATVTASPAGVVTYSLDPKSLGLRTGSHSVSLTGMLLTETARFRSH
jgi:hypothetical protein